MYRVLYLAALLLAIVALTSFGSPAGASPGALPTPMIVAKGKLVNQTSPIPTTTIFTPPQDGLYRLTVYGTIVTADPTSGTFWDVIPVWSDDSGQQTASPFLEGSSNVQGPFETATDNWGGRIAPFEAKAGTPIAYSVTQTGQPDNSVYSLYYTLERLE